MNEIPGNNKLVPVNSEFPDLPAYPERPAQDIEPLGADSISFDSYWEILRSRWTTIFTFAFVITTLVTLVVFRMKPVYRATALMEVQAETPQLQTLNDLNPNAITDASYLQTQVDLLQNNNLARETIQELGLDRDPELKVSGMSGEANSTVSATALQSKLIGTVKKHLHVELLPNSRLVGVSFDSVDPNLAARVANTWVRNYTESNFRSKYDATRQATAWMEKQLDELKAQVEKSQQALVDYGSKNSISQIDDKQNVVQQRLADYSKDLTLAKTDRASKESLYDTVVNNKAEAGLTANDALLQQLDSTYANLQTQYAALTSQYGDNYYKVKEIRNQINEVESLRDKERTRIIDRIESDYKTAVRREQILTQEVAVQNAAVDKLNQLLIPYTMMKRDVDTNQQLYGDLLKRLKDATVSASLHAVNVRLADEALVPTVPISPNRPVDISIAFIVGLILGMAWAFIRESLDRTVKSEEDVERVVGLPTLAVVPLASSSGSRYSYSRYFTREANKAQGNGNLALSVIHSPGSAIAEAYKVLRTSVMLSTAPRPPQVLVVTSANPHEGKTCTSINLALSLAQRGGRVLIVDADLRRPGTSKSLGLTNGAGHGLSSFLTGGHDIDQAIQPIEALPNMWALPAGPIPPNPAELVASSTMETLISDLRLKFDHIVLDSPPLLMVTDGILLSAMADGVVLVVESGGTSRGALNRARQLLSQAGARVLGTVLNKVDHRPKRNYYGSHYNEYYKEE